MLQKNPGVKPQTRRQTTTDNARNAENTPFRRNNNNATRSSNTPSCACILHCCCLVCLSVYTALCPLSTNLYPVSVSCPLLPRARATQKNRYAMRLLLSLNPTAVLTAPSTASVQAPVSSAQDSSANTARVPFIIEYSYAAWGGDEFITICRKGGRERGGRRWERRRRFRCLTLGPLKKILAALATSRLSKPSVRHDDGECRLVVGGRWAVGELYGALQLYGTLLIIIEAQGKARHKKLTSLHPTSRYLLNTLILSQLPYCSSHHILQELYERIPHAKLMRPSPASSPPLHPLP
jgi:hypothetical protein